MGVPAFYRWLSQRYPKIVKDIVEVENEVVDGEIIPVDTLQPNPNGEEYDHLYLDMNGIIHPCFHPEGRPAPTLESEVFECMFEYIDRIFAIVRPRKLLFMAIDGVAPRAKMNQQRSRRFRAAQEQKEKMATEAKLRKEYAQKGIKLNDLDKSEVLDSNVITPGTPFMHRLSAALQFYVHQRMNEDPGWKKINVVLSDSNVPGEGEHKVVDFIRRQRGLDGWNPNTRHVLYGLDADLIMLALATHEPYFYILREVVVDRKRGQQQHLERQLFELNEKENKKKSNKDLIMELSRIDRKPFQMVHIAVLREYLVLDMGNTVEKPVFKVDKERLIDDFILLCFFCGNDFLPHMPTLDIREGALNLLIWIYQNTMPRIGHLSKGENINMKRMEIFIQKVSGCEQAIFAKRKNINHRQLNRQRQQYEADQRREALLKKANQKGPSASASGAGSGSGSGAASNKSAAEALRANLTAPASLKPDWLKVLREGKGKAEGEESAKEKEKGGSGEKEGEEGLKDATEKDVEAFKKTVSDTMRKSGDKLKDILFAPDKIRLGEDGWKVRYYQEKFQIVDLADLPTTRREVVRNYVEGLCWVMKYYYQGCPSWSWYFAFHYAPFASDLTELTKLDFKFEKGEPFKPLNQLMAVLPPASSHCMPPEYGKLMRDKTSEIADFYPETFPVDPNGKRYSWMHIALLPFIDEKRLLAAIAKVEPTLSPEEERRNSLLSTLAFVHKSRECSWPLMELEAAEKKSEAEAEAEGGTGKGEGESKSMTIDPATFNQSNGTAILSAGSEVCPKVIRSTHDVWKDLTTNKVLSFAYAFPPEQVHRAWVLEDTELPHQVLRGTDCPTQPEIWHERKQYNQQYGGRINHNNNNSRFSSNSYGGPSYGGNYGRGNSYQQPYRPPHHHHQQQQFYRPPYQQQHRPPMHYQQQQQYRPPMHYQQHQQQPMQYQQPYGNNRNNRDPNYRPNKRQR